MHAKSDSEVTSLAASSPPRSPRSRPLYFVQSPSRDSHDGDSKVSFHSTPVALSPIGSPLHPAFSSSSRSRDSSQCLLPHSSSERGGRGSTGKSGSRKIHHSSSHHKNSSHPSSEKAWAARNVIHEEADPFDPPSKAPQIYMVLLVLLSCLVFLFLFILFFWLICRPSHPQLSLKNVVFHNFYMGQGADASGVPTKMVSLNCTVQLNFYNPSKYFGVHVTPVLAELDYSELNIAKGEILTYFQDKGTRKTVSVVVQALKVPIYGAGAELSSSFASKHGIPLNMVASLHSQYYVVGKMVKPKFVNQVSCSIVLDSSTMALLTPLHSACTYDPPMPASSHH